MLRSPDESEYLLSACQVAGVLMASYTIRRSQEFAKLGSVCVVHCSVESQAVCKSFKVRFCTYWCGRLFYAEDISLAKKIFTNLFTRRYTTILERLTILIVSFRLYPASPLRKTLLSRKNETYTTTKDLKN